MFSTYDPQDVEILLKDITGMVTPLGTKEREAKIQSGIPYSEMLPIEYVPSEKYLQTFHAALQRNAVITAKAVANVAQKIWAEKQGNVTLVSLARAGTPIGILIKRYLQERYHVRVPHYTISIIRGVGIDDNAMQYILARHCPQSIQFVDGWIGKGAIQTQLTEAMQGYKDVSDGLAVLSDPAGISEKCGTYGDFLIASSCLNSTVSGLLSRTFFRRDIIGERDFHGAAFYSELADNDLTYFFIDTVQQHFTYSEAMQNETMPYHKGMEEANEICRRFQLPSINLVKPGIGEATRVLLRRLPWKVLVHSLSDDEHLGHLYQLAREKQVELVQYPLKNYKACGLIKDLSDT